MPKRAFLVYSSSPAPCCWLNGKLREARSSQDLEGENITNYNLVSPLENALAFPDSIAPTHIATYVNELLRLVENAGIGPGFTTNYLDKLTALYLTRGFSVISLYLAKASYLRLSNIDDPVRGEALDQAKKYARQSANQEDLIQVLLAQAWYFNDSSQYKKAIKVCYECEALICKSSQDLTKYLPGVFAHLGINYYTLWRFKKSKKVLLQARRLIAERHEEENPQLGNNSRNQVLATALHYLGRNAQQEGNLLQAMKLYLKGYAFQERCPEKLSATAFYHLRLGELLIDANLLEQASSHLRESERKFKQIRESSSGGVQVKLAWASIDSKEGKYELAKTKMIEARQAIFDERTGKCKFPRGELLCLVKLFWLELSNWHVLHAIVISFQALVGTLQRGEMRRNNGLRLLGAYLVQVLSNPFKWLWHSIYRAIRREESVPSSLSTCLCPLHRGNSAKEASNTISLA